MPQFGTVTLDSAEKFWLIRCDIHVWSKLKRVFAQVAQAAADQVSLSNTPENCRELLWFLQRYPMKVTPERVLKRQARRHQEMEDRVALLLNHHTPPEPFETATPPREYQSYAASLLELVDGLLLADEVGVGKTLSGILPMTKPGALPALVVTLAHLTSQWVDEIRKFAPQLKVHVLKTGKPYDLIPKRKRGAEISGADRFPDVIICNYHKLHGWHTTLAGVVKYVVFDEVHELRRHESLKHAAAKFIAKRAGKRMGLSATPIMNMGAEIFNVYDVLCPERLGTRDEFVREWCDYDGKKIKDPKVFGAHVRSLGIFLRRTRAELKRELPPVAKVAETIDCDPEVIDRIKGSAIELARTILRTQEQTKGERFRASGEFNLLMRHATGVSKAPYVAEFVRLLLETQEKVVLFGWHRDVYAIWMEALAEFKPVLYTGSESPDQKNKAKEAFVNGDSRVIIISLRAGAGLNGLQEVCNTAVFGELDWSPGIHEQCVGRLWRDGVIGQVMAYYLLSSEGSDPEIASVLGIKLSQIQGIRDPDADLIEELTVEPGNIRRLAESYLSKIYGNVAALAPATDSEALCT